MCRRRIHGHVGPMKPLVQHDVGEDRDLDPVLAQTDEEIPVFGVAVARVETADLARARLAGSSPMTSWMPPGVAVDRIALRTRGGSTPSSTIHSWRPEHAAGLRGGRADSGTGVASFVGGSRSSSSRNAISSPRAWRSPAFWRPDSPRFSWWTYRSGEGRGDLGRAVRGPIVDEDDLERIEVLGEQALERLLEEPLPVVRGDDHGDERRRHLHVGRQRLEQGGDRAGDRPHVGAELEPVAGHARNQARHRRQASLVGVCSWKIVLGASAARAAAREAGTTRALAGPE